MKAAYETQNGRAVNLRFVAQDYTPSAGEQIIDCDHLPDPLDLVPASLESLRIEKNAEINTKAEEVAAFLTAGYSEFEMKTWPQQEAEAIAYDANHMGPTPMIDIMAAERGIPREVYLQKTLVKVHAFRIASAKLVGLRQRYADQVAAAKTPEAIAAINPVFEL